ncbi:unnamed protein product [Calicophoron daubneyi]|uniref:Janus kinase and microtubule-interacting protein C-terminal domain-containing protein n=1 Tax=Calicophoron daubneyi TaxID=300641 RepID=A0AAV2T5J6_CALDB
MDSDSRSEFDTFEIRQDTRFRSPGIMRKNLCKEAINVHSARKSRRAKSTEPTPLDPDDPFIKYSKKEGEHAVSSESANEKRLSVNAKTQENMSKSELINSYRLLMNEKLRLERFLSIMSKNNEMARNRLESDLLDAMMCIEDLKQALELRMARDPREAEERRYLIRQNKKLLNQLYESAKKIERLELTKVEMKEQLELLDFQILEVENQKAMMEEELKKLPSCNNMETQTEIIFEDDSNLIPQLREQLKAAESEVSNQKAEIAAASARQQRLDSMIRELRRDNIELRDQLAKLEDAENSLAESDKPIAAGTRILQNQLNEQLERVRELECKLNASRDYSADLESRLKSVESTAAVNGKSPESEDQNRSRASRPASQSPVQIMIEPVHALSGVYVNQTEAARIEDLLLQQTIRTFQSQLAQRDQEIAQLKKYITQHFEVAPGGEEHQLDLTLPGLYESAIQTEVSMPEAERLSDLGQTLNEGGLLLTYKQGRALLTDIQQSTIALTEGEEENDTEPSSGVPSDLEMNFSAASLVEVISELRHKAEHLRLQMTISSTISQNQSGQAKELRGSEKLQNGEICPQTSQISDLANGDNIKLEEVRAKTGSPGSPVSPSSPHAPEHFSGQLRDLQRTNDLEVARAHLMLSERRRQELERRIMELTEELARARAEARSTETSLSAARRTEAALRRRLLVAMDMQGSDSEPGLVRHSMSVTLGAGAEARDAVELQAALAKAEATNASLNEAAQLNNNRLHEQAMRIGQMEAEHRALLDRISLLQTTEASTQRGIVRLQALYEDMLREYSESRSQELSWRSRERSRSGYRHNVDSEGKRLPSNSRNSPNISKLQRQISDLESENRSLKAKIKNSENDKKSAVITVPVGPCSSPGCVEVRRLLKAFQNRFSEVMSQLTETQRRLNALQVGPNRGTDEAFNDSVMNPSKPQSVGNSLISALNAHINSLKELTQSSSTDQAAIVNNLSSCVRLLDRLDRWLWGYIQQTDTEIKELRSRIIGLELYSSRATSPSSPTTNKEGELLANKQEADLLIQREEEVSRLRKELRALRAQLGSTASAEESCE